jgi:serine/threonine protein kinase
MALKVGDQIGQYELREQLGRGGMAVVFRAYQPSLDREVAIKILQNPSGYVDFVERFRREARSISRLRHPNILTVYDFGEQDGLVYMIGELIEGGTLASRLGQPLQFEWVGVQLAAIASALDYAHASGLVHRDVKPGNILMTEMDLPILSDFGVAKLMQEGAANLTGSGTVVGTPEYMAPEQALGQDVGPPCDIYALGVVLYQMVTGQVPFSGASPVAVALAQVNTPPPPPRSINPELPAAIEQVLLKVLSKNPGARHQSGSELANDFASAAGLNARNLYESAGLTYSAFPRPVTPSGGLLRPITPGGGIPGPPTPGGGNPRTPTPGGGIPGPPSTPRPVSSGRSAAIVPTRIVVEPIKSGTAQRPRPRRLLPIGIALGVVVLTAAFLAPRVTLPWEPPTAAQTGMARIVATPTVVQPAIAPPTLAPPNATTAPPTVTVITSGTGAPTPQLRIAASGRTARITAPANGDRVGESVIVRGAVDGPLSASDHLWLMIRPREGLDNWWCVEQEIRPTPSGIWESRAYFGGKSGLFHRLAVGIADANAHLTITRHLAEQPGQPFEQGLPAGFTRLDEISVEKRLP